jgi:hypothetical protein
LSVGGFIVFFTSVFNDFLAVPRWAGVGDMLEIEKRLVCIKADLLCELIGVCLIRLVQCYNSFHYPSNRSSLCVANSMRQSRYVPPFLTQPRLTLAQTTKQTLDTLIALARTYDLFHAFAARITLHHAHLAHALGGGARALECYGVAAYLAEKDIHSGGTEGSGAEFVRVAARAGEVALRFGICAGGGMKGRRGDDGEGDEDSEEWEEEEEESELKAEEMVVREMGAEVVKECRGLGGTLESVAEVLEACLSSEVLKAKYVFLLTNIGRSAHDITMLIDST